MRLGLVAIFIFTSSLLLAQPSGGGPGDPDDPVPLGGIELLIAAGALFGAKKAFDKKRKG